MFAERIASFLTRYRGLLAGSGLLLFLVFVFGFRFPQVDGQITGTQLETSYFYQSALKLQAAFGNKKGIQIKVVPKEGELSTLLEGIDDFRSTIVKEFPSVIVYSIDTFKDFFELEEILPKESVEIALKKLDRLPFARHLVSRDKKSFQVLLQVPPDIEFDVSRLDLLMQGQFTGVEELKAMSELHIARELRKTIRKDLVQLSIIIFLAILLIFYFSFPSIWSLFYVFILLGVSLAPAFFFFEFFQISINIITLLVFPITLILVLSDAIHLLAGYSHGLLKGKGSLEATRLSFKRYFIPSLLTSLTTSVAFFSFAFNASKNVQNFGLLSGLVTMSVFLLTFSLSPFLLHLFPIRFHQSIDKTWGHRLFQHLDKKRVIYGRGFLFFSILGLGLIPLLHFHTTSETFFPKKSELFRIHEELREDFNSQLAIDILITKPIYPKITPGFQWDTRDIFLTTYRIAEDIQRIPGVSSIASIHEGLSYIYHHGLNREQWHQLEDDNPFVTENGENFRVTVYFQHADMAQEVYGEIQEILEQKKHRVRSYVSGPMLLYREIDRKTSQSLLESLLFSMVGIFFFLLMLTQKWKMSFLGILINIIPLLFLSVIFYFFDLHFNMVTAMTAIVCLGIVVDDTIHVLYRKTYLIEDQLEDLGYGMLTTTFILCSGFFMLIWSQFEPTQVFGIAGAVILLAAVIADLTLLPLGIKWLKERENVS